MSTPTGRKWRKRFLEEGDPGLIDRSRRPHRQPARTDAAVEGIVCETAAAHPAWGAAKVRRRLQDRGVAAVSAASTIHRMIVRNGIERAQHQAPPARQRFEHAAPNQLWQMDYKGHIGLTSHGRCHPLTVLDDHSRFNIVLASCGGERRSTVQTQLTRAFERYGLPDGMLMDNGAPWGATADHPHTRLTAWLMRLGISVYHGRPYHPQTQGKEERFHRTLKVEVLTRRPSWPDLETVQAAFDAWRPVYNFERPHAALGMATPATRYRPSTRSMPATLPPIIYAPDDTIRQVRDHGEVAYRGRPYLVGRAFAGSPVALRPRADGVFDVYYCAYRVARIDLTISADRE